MHLTQDGRFERSDIWREGKWLDLWSVVHFLSGVVFGIAFWLIGLGTAASVVIAFLLFVMYELWEAMVKIEETPQNRVMDVVVGMVSFVPTFLFFPPLALPDFILVAGTLVAVWVTLATFGWLASVKAVEFEKRLRKEYEERKQRRMEKRAARGLEYEGRAE